MTVTELCRRHGMDGQGAPTSSGFIHSGGLGDWRIVGIMDTDGDGNADLIFQNGVGQVAVWCMNGQGAVVSARFIYSGALRDWRIR